MKRLYVLTTVLSLLLFAQTMSAQGTDKILVKAFNLQGKDVLAIDLKGEIEVKQWSEKFTRVHMTIGLTNGSEGMLKSLVKVGRYNLKGVVNDSEFQISMPNIEKTVTVKGTPLIETYSYVIYVPEDVMVKEDNEASTDASFK